MPKIVFPKDYLTFIRRVENTDKYNAETEEDLLKELWLADVDCEGNITNAVIGAGGEVRVLYLQDHKISHIPEQLALFKHLIVLRLNGNGLTKVHFPEALGMISPDTLQLLDLSNNELTHLPDSLGNLSTLRKLNLSMNHLRDLPSSLTQLNNLGLLSIVSNYNLFQLPALLTNLPALHRFEISNWMWKIGQEGSGGIEEVNHKIIQRLKRSGVIVSDGDHMGSFSFPSLIAQLTDDFLQYAPFHLRNEIE